MNTINRPHILIALAFAALVVLAVTLVEAVARGIGLAHGDDVEQLDAGPLEQLDAGTPAADDLAAVMITPAPITAAATAPPAATPDLVERLARSGKLASAVQIALHLLLNFGLARWAWLCQLAPWLGRWKWAAIASAAAAALTVTLPVAATGTQTWEMLLWPLGVAIAQVILPSNNPAGPRKLPATAAA